MTLRCCGRIAHYCQPRTDDSRVNVKREAHRDFLIIAPFKILLLTYLLTYSV